MIDTEKTIRERLFSMCDEKYREFNSKLIPSVAYENVIGVRTPDLRKYAAEISKTPLAGEFINILPHKYFEENNLHAFLIEKIKDFDTAIEKTELFLPYVDNWATCDQMSPKVFGKHKEKLMEKIRVWISSGKTYTVRYGIGMLMRFYLDEDFSTEYLDMVSSVKSEEYYVNMMIAWFFATALAKQYDASLPYIEKHILPEWVHKKTIRKAIESYRIGDERKKILRGLM